ncbi:MAG: radical SAM family heme chaperone HemW [Fimbriiglobus sp.]
MIASWQAPSWLEPRTAYIHIPFCGHHCGYCDFAVTAGQDHLIDLYLEALELELQALGQPAPVESLFVGGGTPTYLSAQQLDRLFTAINAWLPRVGGLPEVSIESTPESWTLEKVAVLAGHGVNRVSIGVQSFHAHLLKALDRQHLAEQIPAALDMLRPAIPQLSLDLIFAAPGQTLTEWQHDLTTALSHRPDHLSTYGLTYETGTPLWKARKRGVLMTVSEDAETEMYLESIATLTAAGYEHYEISNFAKLACRSAHNQRYWANDAYHGFGVGAARYVNSSRELNVRDTKTYIRKLLAGEPATFQAETLAPHDRAIETAAVQLRRLDGIDADEFQTRTGFALTPLFADELESILNLGLLTWQGRHLKLTASGKLVADGVIEQLMKYAAS